MIGVRSTARLLDAQTKPWLAGFYTLAWLLFWASGSVAGLGVGYVIGLALVAAHFAWQIIHVDIHDGANCLSTFKSNRDLGLIMLGAIVAGLITG
jgi:4-hydroxybenzoate polyprenyltransferase